MQIHGRAMGLLACIAIATAILLALTAEAPPLTPEQRALILGNPGSVASPQHIAQIALEGTDYRGFYKCPYMKVYVNGHGPFTFLFDTGASYTMLSSKVVKAAQVRVALDRGGYHDLLHVDRMQVGDVEIRDYTTVRDDDFGVDGVFGFKAFGDWSVLFDLAHRQLRVSPEPMPLQGGFELPYEATRNVPLISVTVGDTARVPTLLDTGDDAYAWEARSQDLKGATYLHTPTAAANVLNGANVQRTAVTTLADTLHFGPLAIAQPVVAVNDELPVSDFGVDFLTSFLIEFEPKRMVIAFQPLVPDSALRVRGDRSPGFTLRFDSHGTVLAVLPGSAAERADMRPGDKVLELEGRSAREINPRAWDEMLEKHSRLLVRWLRGTTERTEPFEVTELR